MTATALNSTTEQISSVETWSLDPSHTRVGFAVKHLMISNVKGRFTGVTGSVQLNQANPRVDVSIDAASITTADEKRDAHLRSADFLHADQFPTLQFRADRVEGDVDSKFTLVGDLTIRGVTRPVKLHVVNEGRITDPWGNSRLGFTAATRINRKDFGLQWNVGLETGGVLVGDEVRVTIEGELVRQQ